MRAYSCSASGTVRPLTLSVSSEAEATEIRDQLKRAVALQGARDVVKASAAHDRRLVIDVMEVSTWVRR